MEPRYRERVEDCSRCGGAGRLLIRQCMICGQARDEADDCACTDDDVESYVDRWGLDRGE